jgi:hypothetical protein
VSGEKDIPILSSIGRRYSDWSSARLDRRLLHGDAFWLFILGVNNSGTTILTNILETHPQIRTLPAEGQHLTAAFPRPNLLGVGRLWSSRMDIFRWREDFDPRPALQAKKDWARLYPKRKGILLEKSPPNTVRSLWLQRNFEPSRFLSIIRSPYAVCEGIRRRKEYTIDQAALHWKTANQCLLDDLASIEHQLLIKYEDLADDPQRSFEEIQAFLGLDTPFELDELMRVQAHSYQGTTAGLQNLNAHSLQNLSRDDIDQINRICGDLMHKLGYALL